MNPIITNENNAVFGATWCFIPFNGFRESSAISLAAILNNIFPTEAILNIGLIRNIDGAILSKPYEEIGTITIKYDYKNSDSGNFTDFNNRASKFQFDIKSRFALVDFPHANLEVR